MALSISNQNILQTTQNRLLNTLQQDLADNRTFTDKALITVQTKATTDKSVIKAAIGTNFRE